MKLSTTILFFLGYLNFSIACSCFGPDNFCATIENQPNLTIVKGKKLNEVAHGMDFEVTEVIQGEKTNDVIRIWGDPGHLCRLYVSTFSDGEELILALRQLEQTAGEWGGAWADLEDVGDYEISVCGVHYVQLSDNNQIAAAEDCLGDIMVDCAVINPNLFPLPADNQIFMNVSNLSIDAQDGTLSLFDFSGKQVAFWSDIKVIREGDFLKLEVGSLSAGVYFLKVDVPGICSETKVEKVIIH